MSEREVSVGDLPTVERPNDRQENDPRPASLPADSVVTNPPPGYEILGELGRGGMGVVYRARQIRANREVALKMIISGGNARESELTRFRIEGEAVARLQHPNIISVFEVGEHQGLPFFSMEYCPNGALSSVTRGKCHAPREAALLLHKIASGVATAHAAGIVHRDLKPQNILLAADGTPKVSDFGIAKRIQGGEGEEAHAITQTGAVLGTPSYMAPEQAFGESKHVGPEADVHALGAILYALLLGKAPFVGTSPVETMMKVVSEAPERLRSARPEIPRDLEAICLKCLEKDRRRRYANAAELALDLEKFLDGETISITQAGVLGRFTGAMDRVQIQEQFAGYGSMMLALAPIMFFPGLLLTAIAHTEAPGYVLQCVWLGSMLAFFAAFGCLRKWKWLPVGSAERHLWMVWGGYMACCVAMSIGRNISLGTWSPADEFAHYRPIAVLTGLAFFSLAANFWGYCALIGGVFVAVSFLMPLDFRYAPIEFSSLWGIVLLSLGLRLRSMSSTPSPA